MKNHMAVLMGLYVALLTSCDGSEGTQQEQRHGSEGTQQEQRRRTRLAVACAESSQPYTLSWPNATDADLSDLCEMRGSEPWDLLLGDSRITDEGLRIVAILHSLTRLNLDRTTVTDKGLCHLERLRGLRRLELCECPNITDEGLRSLSHLRNLWWLELEATAITDGGLRHLEAMKNLEFLFLTGCPNITDAGVVRLQKALPNCLIDR
jgi:hypothetical protein